MSSKFGTALNSGKFVITAEVAPPVSADQVGDLRHKLDLRPVLHR